MYSDEKSGNFRATKPGEPRVGIILLTPTSMLLTSKEEDIEPVISL
jgi:hypothetical protein